MVQPSLSPADFDELLDAGTFSETFASKANKRVPLEQMVESWGPLSAEHVKAAADHEASGEIYGLDFNRSVKALRHTHHRLAQLLAGGMDETIAAKLCNYTPQRVSHLKADPAFAELLAHYGAVRDDAFADFVDAAAALNIDMLGRLQEILDESPEKITPQIALEAVRVLSDRTGHAPVTKNVNVNMNLGLGDRLREARLRADEADLRNITPKLEG